MSLMRESRRKSRGEQSTNTVVQQGSESKAYIELRESAVGMKEGINVDNKDFVLS